MGVASVVGLGLHLLLRRCGNIIFRPMLCERYLFFRSAAMTGEWKRQFNGSRKPNEGRVRPYFLPNADFRVHFRKDTP